MGKAEEFATEFRAFAQELPGLLEPEMMAGLLEAANDAAEHFKTRGMAQGTYAKSKPWKGHAVFVQASGLLGAIVAVGIPAMLERGGKTKQHQIYSKGGKILHLGGKGRFKRGGGRQTGFAKGAVMHPGSKVRAHPELAAAMDRALPGMVARMDARIQAAGDAIP